MKTVNQWVRGHNGLFSFVEPKAGGMAFVRYNSDIHSSHLVTRLREERSVLIIAGDHFGMDKYIRIGFGAESNYLKKGLAIVSDFFDKLNR